MPESTFIQVVLPLRLGWEPCYRAPGTVRPGDRVTVLFARRQYVAVVHRIGVTPDFDASKVQDIIEADCGLPSITPRELALWEFISSYYLCSIGEVYYAAYPHMKVDSERLAVRASRAAERRKALELETMGRRLEVMRARLAAKDEAIMKRRASVRSNADVTARLESERDRLAESIARLQATIDSYGTGDDPSGRMCLPVAGKSPRPCLLQAPSRLQCYSEQIHATLAGGRQVLVLTPDILYCRSLSSALGQDFPGLSEFTSKESAVRRRRISDAVRDGSARLVVGTRSAVFLPFDDLGLIIVDEEQDTFYKQEEPAPRYNGRDCAVKLAQIHGARVVLGSSCPSLETMLNASAGRYGIMPGSGPVASGAEVIDIAAERRKKGVCGLFTFKLVEAVRHSSGKVVLIRGWERQEELIRQVGELFPGLDVTVMRWLEAREADLSDTAMVGIMQADALVEQDDFRADERAAQIVSQLASRCPRLVVQTNVPSRFDGSRTLHDLLDERRDFGFPPYTRAVDLRIKGTGEVTQRFFLRKDASLASRKAEIAASAPKDSYVDVDPR